MVLIPSVPPGAAYYMKPWKGKKCVQHRPRSRSPKGGLGVILGPGGEHLTSSFQNAIPE